MYQDMSELFDHLDAAIAEAQADEPLSQWRTCVERDSAEVGFQELLELLQDWRYKVRSVHSQNALGCSGRAQARMVECWAGEGGGGRGARCVRMQVKLGQVIRDAVVADARTGVDTNTQLLWQRLRRRMHVALAKRRILDGATIFF